jgi:hypothetical protein
VFRHITLREFETLVARELRMRPEEFTDDAFRRTAKLSLDRPAARRPMDTGQRGRELHRSLPDKAVALVQGLLDEPPVADYPGRVALAALDELLRRGHGRWQEHRVRTVVRWDQWARSGEFDARWVRERIGSLGRPSRQRSEKLFGESPLVVGLYLGGPLSEVRRAGDSRMVPELHQQMECELRNLEVRLDGLIRFRLFHPSHDVESRSSVDLWEWDLGLLEEEVAVLLVAEIGTHAIGFGGACELSHFRKLPGEAAHLLSHQCEQHSNYLLGFGHEIGVETLPFSDWQQIPSRVADFLQRRAQHILDAMRRRDDAILLVEEAHRRIVAQWNGLTKARRLQVLDDADLSLQKMERVVQRPAAFAALSAFSQSRLRDVLLGVDGGSSRPSADATDDLDVAPLLRLAAAAGWPAEEIATTHRAAVQRRGNVRPAAAARMAYADADSWRALHDELFGV